MTRGEITRGRKKAKKMARRRDWRQHAAGRARAVGSCSRVRWEGGTSTAAAAVTCGCCGDVINWYSFKNSPWPVNNECRERHTERNTETERQRGRNTRAQSEGRRIEREKKKHVSWLIFFFWKFFLKIERNQTKLEINRDWLRILRYHARIARIDVVFFVFPRGIKRRRGDHREIGIVVRRYSVTEVRGFSFNFFFFSKTTPSVTDE